MQADFEEIYIRYARRLYLFIYSKCRNREMTEDILQTTFLKAIENISSFRGECDIYTWLCKIALNSLFREMKKKSDIASLDALSEEWTAAELPDIAPAPADIVIQNEEREELYRHIEQLPRRWQELVKLRLQELSFKEIAQRLGKTENWAKVNYSRAKERLKSNINKNK